MILLHLCVSLVCASVCAPMPNHAVCWSEGFPVSNSSTDGNKKKTKKQSTSCPWLIFVISSLIQNFTSVSVMIMLILHQVIVLAHHILSFILYLILILFWLIFSLLLQFSRLFDATSHICPKADGKTLLGEVMCVQQRGGGLTSWTEACWKRGIRGLVLGMSMWICKERRREKKRQTLKQRAG